uniref:Uncharacterized protein n=1 Tax=Sparus aurata TaxID=8175 RepID=A0A671Y302_SPAAU
MKTVMKKSESVRTKSQNLVLFFNIRSSIVSEKLVSHHQLADDKIRKKRREAETTSQTDEKRLTVELDMDHLLMLLLLLWSSGLRAEGAQCETSAKADIVLVLNSSGSMTEADFERIRSSATDIISAFDIGPDRVQIALVLYSFNVITQWYLNTHQNKQAMLEDVSRIPHLRSLSNTGRALKYILQNIFQPNVGMRADSEKIAVLITESDSSDDVDSPSQALKDAGIEVYTVGFHYASERELRSIASDPDEDHVLIVENSQMLGDIVDILTINLCDSIKSSERVRLVGGSSRCAGALEVKRGEWRPVFGSNWTLTSADVMCKELDCGSAASTGRRNESSNRAAWEISPDCVESGSDLNECLSSGFSSSIIKITCSDSVRLVNGTSLCSGRLEVKSDQSNQSNQWWSSVCEADFDQQDGEVVCRELGCGAPLVLWGALYGEVKAPMWTKEFHCEGNESALLDCRSSGSAGKTCSPGKAVGLTCSERVRLVGGSSRCAGALEVKRGEWRPVFGSNWTLTSADVMCKELDCGSAASTGRRDESSNRAAWEISPDCVESGSALNECLSSGSSSSIIKITCSDSVRLVNGTSLCSGRLEVKSDQSNQSNQSNQWWSLVCEADFDQRDAEVVCRELGCGAPSVLWGALYGEVEAPMWTKEFHCEGNESALLDCRSAGSAGNTCSPGKAVGLTCSERVRLVGGSSRCAGALEVKQGDWRPVYDSNWTLTSAAEVCRELHCGSVVSTELRIESTLKSSWEIRPDCVQSGSALRECMSPMWSSSFLEVTCSGPTVSSIGLVRLVVLSLGLLLLITVVCVTHQVTFIALLIKAPAQMKHFACEY